MMKTYLVEVTFTGRARRELGLPYSCKTYETAESKKNVLLYRKKQVLDQIQKHTGTGYQPRYIISKIEAELVKWGEYYGRL